MSDSPPPPYGAPPPGSYGQQPFYRQPDHPQATTVLILGILGLVLCQVISPFAWAMGNRALREIDASGGQLGGRSQVSAGRICGIIGTILIVASVGVLLFFLVIFVVLGVGAASFS